MSDDGMELSKGERIAAGAAGTFFIVIAGGIAFATFGVASGIVGSLMVKPSMEMLEMAIKGRTPPRKRS